MLPHSFLITLLALAPVDVLACTILPEAQQIQADAEKRKELIRMVREIAAKATHVFVARVVNIEEEYEDRIVDGVQRTFKISRPALEMLTSIKGSGEIDDLFWEEEPNRITVSCRSTAYMHQISLIPTYRYLVYVRGREILRAEGIVDWPIGLTTEEELALARAGDSKRSPDETK